MSAPVFASAAHELFVAMVNLTLTPEQARGMDWAEALHRTRPGLTEAARSFFPTPLPWVRFGSELFVMAAALGYLEETDANRLLADLPELPARALALPPAERLAPEYPVLADLVRDRLRTLAGDRVRMTAYHQLVAELWDALRPEWEARGLALARKEAAMFGEQLEHGAPLTGLLPQGHIALLEQFRPVTTAYAAHGRARVLPSYFGRGSHAWEVGGTLYLGYGFLTQGLQQLEQERARRAAARLKALADPTRLRLLAYISQVSVSVSDLAAILSLTQPTVSEHLRHLRDADLVHMHREGNKVYYRTDPTALDALLHLIRDITVR